MSVVVCKYTVSCTENETIAKKTKLVLKIKIPLCITKLDFVFVRKIVFAVLMIGGVKRKSECDNKRLLGYVGRLRARFSYFYSSVVILWKPFSFL